MAKNFQLRVLTPEGAALSAEVSSLTVPAADGELGILANHAPVLALMSSGVMRYTDAAGQKREVFVSGGFLHVRTNEVILLAEEYAEISALDEEQTKAKLTKAQEMPADNNEARQRRSEAVKRAQAALNAIAHAKQQVG